MADGSARYVRHLEDLRAAVGDERRAMELAVGGEFEAFGSIEVQLLRHVGLAPTGSVVDVGCGSGRLAVPLARSHRGEYLGTDVVPDLVEFARRETGRPEWRFEVVDDLVIPAADASADLVCFFSVLTHLLHEESYVYLREAHRVLRRGGLAVFSFLEFAVPHHWAVFEATVDGLGNGQPHNQFLDRDAVTCWAREIGFGVRALHAGDEPFIPLSDAVTFESGARLEDRAAFGQSVAVLSK
jgi:ubiquinone/menaquinone biosynthesis C-methylase UbiE